MSLMLRVPSLPTLSLIHLGVVATKSWELLENFDPGELGASTCVTSRWL